MHTCLKTLLYARSNVCKMWFSRLLVNLTDTSFPLQRTPLTRPAETCSELRKPFTFNKRASSLKTCVLLKRIVFRLQWTIGHSNIEVTDLLNYLNKVAMYLNHCFTHAKIHDNRVARCRTAYAITTGKLFLHFFYKHR